ncbi:Transforming protein v-Fos/v-Fox [Chionoecetes opilio]|uniref:Transforming protein v-Fos/v-Fox n=1 Tax=Chionoecetes opilio TaxID=41210 RepID=A0A8J4XYL2_CHIOP|nr:Transforming protein v-Fos/v-Fox [Chionoecetes opilio]
MKVTRVAETYKEPQEFHETPERFFKGSKNLPAVKLNTHTMYLNVNLTPPDPSAAEGSCTTPKTPEILNSLINLTSPPLPYSYSQYQCEVYSGALQSPVSDLSSPGDESAAGTFVSLSGKRGDGRYLADAMGLTSRYPCGGGGGLVGGSPGTSGLGGPLAGASPPSTPDLPSPVSTLEATKSALIKEGLKLQIRSKLQAAGVDTPESLLDETKIFKDLTEEDEQRRRRRRERNKVAATKCRNKKKEKTCYLMTESESVEDVNLRLKTEIQRLNSEKMKLEKILRDPNHRAHCRHSGRCSKAATCHTQRPPLVIVTPAESPDTTTSSSSSSSASSTSSSSSLESPTSPPLPNSSSYDPLTSVAPRVTSLPQGSLSMTTLPLNTTTTSSDSVSCASSSSSQYLAPKFNPAQVINQRHHTYQFPERSHQSSGVGGEKQGYASPASPPSCQIKPSYNKFSCLGVPQTYEFVPPTPPSQKSMYNAPKPRSGGLIRYNPYSTRPPPVTSPLATHTHPQPMPVACVDSYVLPNNSTGCGREDQQAFVADMHTNQFFPPCSYTNM